MILVNSGEKRLDKCIESNGEYFESNSRNLVKKIIIINKIFIKNPGFFGPCNPKNVKAQLIKPFKRVKMDNF